MNLEETHECLFLKHISNLTYYQKCTFSPSGKSTVGLYQSEFSLKQFKLNKQANLKSKAHEIYFHFSPAKNIPLVLWG